MERTLAIIKPDAVRRQLVGVIISEIEKKDFHIAAIKTQRLTVSQAAIFYEQHRAKPFYDSLVAYMSSGQLFALIIEKPHAIQAWRQMMGPTNPEKAEPGSLRRLFAIDVQQNSVHGADSLQTAKREINFFFGEGG
jgi:nucleoside-diphosphate kinase